MQAAIADAAFIRSCSTVTAALQPKSPEQSLMNSLEGRTRTALSTQVSEREGRGVLLYLLLAQLLIS